MSRTMFDSLSTFQSSFGVKRFVNSSKLIFWNLMSEAFILPSVIFSFIIRNCLFSVFFCLNGA